MSREVDDRDGGEIGRDERGPHVSGRLLPCPWARGAWCACAGVRKFGVGREEKVRDCRLPIPQRDHQNPHVFQKSNGGPPRRLAPPGCGGGQEHRTNVYPVLDPEPLPGGLLRACVLLLFLLLLLLVLPSSSSGPVPAPRAARPRGCSGPRLFCRHERHYIGAGMGVHVVEASAAREASRGRGWFLGRKPRNFFFGG
jgi:hypothetical protein